MWGSASRQARSTRATASAAAWSSRASTRFQFGGASTRSSPGFRPSFPDSRPVIGRSRDDGRVFYAFGHGHHGLTQAAATAEIVAALVAGRTPPIDAAPYSPARF